jgi:hypothetical protein
VDDPEEEEPVNEEKGKDKEEDGKDKEGKKKAKKPKKKKGKTPSTPSKGIFIILVLTNAAVEPNFRWSDTGKRILLQFNVNLSITSADLKINMTKTTIKIELNEEGQSKTLLDVLPRSFCTNLHRGLYLLPSFVLPTRRRARVFGLCRKKRKWDSLKFRSKKPIRSQNGNTLQSSCLALLKTDCC